MKLDDATNISIETAAEHRPKWENIPTSSAAPDDPGVVAYWNQDGKKYAAPCDKWDNLRDNAQAIYHYLKAKRGMERWGVEVENEYVTQQVEKVPVDD